MSCIKCDEAQEEGFHTYIRVETSDMLISGCEEHMKALIERNRGHSK